MTEAGKRLIAATVGAFLVGTVFAALYLSAFHSPRPRDLPVAVAAPPPALAQLRAALDRRAPGALDLRPVADERAATAAVLERDVAGALVMAPAQPPRLLVATAGGSAPAQALREAFAAMAAAQHQQLQVRDLAPLPARDRQGLSLFFLTVGMLLSGVIGGVASGLLARGVRPALQAAALLGLGAALGLADAWIASDLVGAVDGHFWALAGLCALFSVAVSLPVAAGVRVTPAAAALALLLFIAVGVPASGGPAALSHFEPGFFRFFAPWLPAGVAVEALRGAVYFDGNDVAGGAWILAAWAAGGLAALIVGGRLAALRASRARR